MPYDRHLADRTRVRRRRWSVLDDDAVLHSWRDRGVNYARSLPPK